jgi:hypothetical protein
MTTKMVNLLDGLVDVAWSGLCATVTTTAITTVTTTTTVSTTTGTTAAVRCVGWRLSGYCVPVIV